LKARDAPSHRNAVHLISPTGASSGATSGDAGMQGLEDARRKWNGDLTSPVCGTEDCYMEAASSSPTFLPLFFFGWRGVGGGGVRGRCLTGGWARVGTNGRTWVVGSEVDTTHVVGMRKRPRQAPIPSLSSHLVCFSVRRLALLSAVAGGRHVGAAHEAARRRRGA
jgi:hypothetical protein